MSRIDFAAFSPAEVLAVVAHEARHCLMKDGEGLEALFDQIPIGSRHAALRALFDISVDELSGVLLAFAVDRGLLALPGFTDDLGVALQLRDRFFSHPSPLLETGHFDLLRSMAGPLGLDFSINSMEDAYSERHIKGRDAVDGTDRINFFAENLKLVIAFCDPETLRDKAVGNAALRQFTSHAENAIANHAASAAEDHLRVLSQLDFDDLAAMLSVISANEIARLPMIVPQFTSALFSKAEYGLGKFERYGLRPAFSYLPEAVFDHLETLSDQALRRLVNPDFLDSYLNRKWMNLGECNSFLLTDAVFIARLDKFNARLLADPFIKSLLKDHYSGAMHVSKLIATPKMEEAGLTIRLACPMDYNDLAGQLRLMKELPHMSAFFEKGKQIIELSFAEEAKRLYSLFYASGVEVPDPESMTSRQTTQAAMVLMACDYALFVGDQKINSPRFMGTAYRNKSMDVVASLFLNEMPQDEVVQLIKDVPMYMRCLINKNLIDSKYLQQLPPKELAQQFGQDLGL